MLQCNQCNGKGWFTRIGGNPFKGCQSRTKVICDCATYNTLRAANQARQAEWPGSDVVTPSFRTVEFAGEAGEVCNVVKKLERERLGIAGSRDTIEHLAQELADVLITTDLIAADYGIDLDQAVRDKFNADSKKMGLKTMLVKS